MPELEIRSLWLEATCGSVPWAWLISHELYGLHPPPAHGLLNNRLGNFWASLSDTGQLSAVWGRSMVTTPRDFLAFSQVNLNGLTLKLEENQSFGSQ